jgi:hypothetical protein
MQRMRLIFILSVLSYQLIAQIGGSGIYSFINLPVPARTAALGGNSIHIKDEDLSLMMQNPALLNSDMHQSIGLNYIRHIAGINHTYLTYAHHYKKAGTFGAGLQHLGYGKFSERDEYGKEIGSFRANDYSFNVSFARQKDSLFSYGITVKTIFSKYYTYSSFGNALDAGFTYHHPKQLLTISVVLSNLGYQWKTYSGTKREKIIPNLQIGISKKVPKAPFRICLAYEYLNIWDLTYTVPQENTSSDLFNQNQNQPSKFRLWGDKFLRHWIFATEVIITKNLHLRVGFDYRRRKEMILPDKRGLAGISFGFGFRVYKFHFSYAYSQYHTAANANHISVTTFFNSFVKKSLSEAKPVQP